MPILVDFRCLLVQNPSSSSEMQGRSPRNLLGSSTPTGKKKLGDIIHLDAFGTHIIVLNSYKAARELLDLRLAYADRPVRVMDCELMGMGRTAFLSPYNDTWKSCRKLMHPNLRKTAMRQYHTLLERNVRTCMVQLLEAPEGFFDHLQLFTGKSLLMFTYGIEVNSIHDEFIATVEDLIDRAIRVAHPSAAIVNAIPILKHIPSWFPGAGFKRTAGAFRAELDDAVQRPFDRVKAELAAGTAVPSFTSSCLQDGSYNDYDMIWSAGSMYFAGSDTTLASLKTFILAMALYPDVQKRAQTEVDKVTKANALPTLEDRDSTPYIACLLKELQRWIPVTPMNLPHRPMEPDYYNGYFIPEGSVVLPNVWAITRDEANYKDPERFWPERFELPEPELDPYEYAFGFGRRRCPGIHFSDAMTYATVVSILATFDISKPRDENGEELDVEYSLSTGIFCCPDPFKCTIRPRPNVNVAQLLRSSVDEQA
ncbi:hypothetical protein BOTBODRAFT_25823 [Botryobasidium botryosum FD-172 SS1]|uniref:Cytochrome P450 n=1 Tax=Botryobasidium botryosum (strain FD-172 SS1) TaxID=930990 RepID=A0A067N076_BOTB1|nr:hypothetical protein BOTBODRAFT_25823 [Botryobasidium botryosum FD-172 SS1]